jgi:GNAT superfamily N-acetyltransferase
VSVAIREIVPGDYDRWRPLFDGYNAFYGREGPTALKEEVVATAWRRFLDPAEPMHALLAESPGGEVLGLAHYLFHRSTTMLGPTCYLQDLFTVPHARGQGVGRALIEAVAARAARAGAERLYWTTHESNATAMRLYDQVAERSGFVVYRRPIYP